MRKVIFTLMFLATTVGITAQITRRGGNWGSARWDLIGDALVITTTSNDPIVLG